MRSAPVLLHLKVPVVKSSFAIGRACRSLRKIDFKQIAADTGNLLLSQFFTEVVILRIQIQYSAFRIDGYFGIHGICRFIPNKGGEQHKNVFGKLLGLCLIVRNRVQDCCRDHHPLCHRLRLQICFHMENRSVPVFAFADDGEFREFPIRRIKPDRCSIQFSGIQQFFGLASQKDRDDLSRPVTLDKSLVAEAFLRLCLLNSTAA